MAVRISEVERAILATQLRILAKLSDEHDRKSLETSAEIFERGYVSEYSKGLGAISNWKDLPEDRSRYVIAVFDMFSAIKNARENLQAPTSNDKELSFDGFEDASLSLYAKFLIDNLGQYSWMKIPDYSLPSDWKYFPMLRIYKELGEPHSLSEDHLQKFVGAVQQARQST